MTIIGVIIFFIGWIYAMGQFGFFIGFGLGWLPALFIAWILDFAILIAFGLIGVTIGPVVGKRK